MQSKALDVALHTLAVVSAAHFCCGVPAMSAKLLSLNAAKAAFQV
jgi:hypothetical protein